VVRADDQAEDVRHDQADEADDTGDGDGRGGDDARDGEAGSVRSLDLDPERVGVFLAHQEDVQVVRVDVQDGEGEERGGRVTSTSPQVLFWRWPISQ